MSFGHAASRRTRVVPPDDSAPCPCGSGADFGGCCGPLLSGEPAPTAERLMRSRYTAFALGDSAYLSRSWHPRTVPDVIEIDPNLRWTGLRIDALEAGGIDDEAGVVEFTASWVDGSASPDARGALHERSRFVRRGGQWRYVDGELG